MTKQITQVAEIDWDQWKPEQTATLLFVVQNNHVLLIEKKRGLGAGNINGPGGKVDPGETPLECAIRETQEELLITPGGVHFVAELLFHAYDFPRIHAFAYIADHFSGVPRETEEAVPIWFPIDAIPFNKMWEDDQYWLPRVLEGEILKGKFTFQGESLVDFLIEPIQA
jgi:8-oxo-dGTP diphosphatase